MRDQERLVLKLVAGLLDYPGHPAFWMRLREHASLAEEADARLGAVSKALQRVVPIELEKLYVAAFDFDPKGSLYVTAHELGDSRDRGQALIELTELCQKAGYDVPDDQLADYLPLLLELMAVYPDSVASLAERVSSMAGRIAEHLGPDHLYRPLFDLIQETLGRPNAADVPSVEEHPDLVDLPYPIEY
ncbi:MAG: nitrate reductase molybdenum cofactor assembly chaperone [Firmicutes bacterium]|nr:nitrate reductase molybdenum cofactor assembly chaperone [Bacillota bacterium]